MSLLIYCIFNRIVSFISVLSHSGNTIFFLSIVFANKSNTYFIIFLLDNSVKEKEKKIKKIIYLKEIFGTAKNTKEQLRKHIYHPNH